jgi:predicted esterase
MGGGGAWYLGIKYPQLWAGLAPVAPAIYTDPVQVETIRHIPVILIQGDADALVPVGIARAWAANMERLGMRFSKKTFPTSASSTVPVEPVVVQTRSNSGVCTWAQSVPDTQQTTTETLQQFRRKFLVNFMVFS